MCFYGAKLYCIKSLKQNAVGFSPRNRRKAFQQGHFLVTALAGDQKSTPKLAEVLPSMDSDCLAAFVDLRCRTEEGRFIGTGRD